MAGYLELGFLREKFPQIAVSYIEDDWLQKWAWRSRVFRPLVAVIFHHRAARLAGRLAKGKQNAVVHFNTPVSPVRPYFAIPGVPLERNLSGISFAVANVTGFLARLLEADPGVRDVGGLASVLRPLI